MRKLILCAALVASTAAQAGYYYRVPNDSNYHYYPRQNFISPYSPQLEELRQEMRRSQPRTCTTRPIGDGMSVTNCY